MSAAPTSTILFRPDTLLGVCQAIGDDLGFNPTWLRALLACGVFVNLGAAVAVYLALGAVVAASRWLHPAPAQPSPVVSLDEDETGAAVEVVEPDYAPELKVAA
jgi:phage shock protein C